MSAGLSVACTWRKSRLPSGLSIRRTRSRNAASWAPQVTKLTSQPELARRAPK
jgi:hypothetical protein